MVVVHPSEAEPCGGHQPPSKRRRLSTHTWVCPVRHVDPVTGPEITTASSARLDLLPPEILLIILEFSLEASLIHTSKRIWCNLPAYVHYTKSLALKALVQLEDWPEWPGSDSEHCKDMVRLQRDLDPATQCHLRQIVFASGWFKQRQLHRTHRTLLYWTIMQCCSWYGENAPSKYQRQRIKYFVERQAANSSSVVLHLRVPSGGRRIRYLSAKQLSVTISGAPFFRPLSFHVLDFGGTVPDDLLRTPLTASKVFVIRDMCRAIWVPREQNKMRCNRRLLHQAILECIAFCDTDKFHVLLSLEERSRSTEEFVVLDLAQIRQAVIHGRSSMLIRLIKQMWTSPKTQTVSDVDLINVINEAKATEYLNFHNMTRILAMEVAAKWKMAEVEAMGWKAHRVPMDWPPKLIYPIPNTNDSQVWFIPRDSHHDVDWEASRGVPWLPMEYFSP